MRQSKTETKTLIRTETRISEGYTYLYELIMKESRQTASYKMRLYSIRIRMTDIEGRNTEAEIRDAFADSGRAILFFEKLVNNLATPIDLSYILEDETVK